MSSTDFIRKRLAFFLLVVFAISITPKAFFHDAFSRHSDEIVCKDKDKSAPHFHRPSFHCSFDDLVVTAPFLSAEQSHETYSPEVCVDGAASYSSALLSSSFLYTEGRGPPLI